MAKVQRCAEMIFILTAALLMLLGCSGGGVEPTQADMPSSEGGQFSQSDLSRQTESIESENDKRMREAYDAITQHPEKCPLVFSGESFLIYSYNTDNAIPTEYGRQVAEGMKNALAFLTDPLKLGLLAPDPFRKDETEKYFYAVVLTPLIKPLVAGVHMEPYNWKPGIIIADDQALIFELSLSYETACHELFHLIQAKYGWHISYYGRFTPSMVEGFADMIGGWGEQHLFEKKDQGKFGMYDDPDLWNYPLSENQLGKSESEQFLGASSLSDGLMTYDVDHSYGSQVFFSYLVRTHDPEFIRDLLKETSLWPWTKLSNVLRSRDTTISDTLSLFFYDFGDDLCLGDVGERCRVIRSPKALYGDSAASVTVREMGDALIPIAPRIEKGRCEIFVTEKGNYTKAKLQKYWIYAKSASGVGELTDRIAGGEVPLDGRLVVDVTEDGIIYLYFGSASGVSIRVDIDVDVKSAPNATASVITEGPYSPGDPVEFDASNSIDPDGIIVTYEWDFNGDNKYGDAYDAGSNTHPVVIYENPGTYSVDLKVTDNDGFTDTLDKKIKIIVSSNATWHVETADSWGTAGLSPCLSISPQGNPCISYHRGQPDFDLMFVERKSGGWDIPLLVENMAYNSDVFDGTSLAFNLSGNPTISYLHHIPPGTFYGKLWFAESSGSSWSTSMVPDSHAVGQHSSLAYDKEGNPCIAYHEYVSYNGGVRFAQRVSGTWNIEYIDSNPGEVGGTFVSLVIDSNDVPHVSYAAGPGSSGGGELRYATKNGSGWIVQKEVDKGLGGAWPMNQIYTSIALASDNKPCIAYRNALAGDLKFARLTTQGWSVETVPDESAADVGYWCSLKIDENNVPYISYHDLTNHQVKVAIQTAPATWNITEIDSGLASIGYADTYTSLALDTSGNPCVAYYSAGSADLKFALFY